VARYIADEGVSRDRLRIIPNGADPADFETSSTRAALRSRYGFDGVTFVYAGAHGPANGLDFVLDAAGALAPEVPEARLVRVGEGQRCRGRSGAVRSRRGRSTTGAGGPGASGGVGKQRPGVHGGAPRSHPNGRAPASAPRRTRVDRPTAAGSDDRARRAGMER